MTNEEAKKNNIFNMIYRAAGKKVKIDYIAEKNKIHVLVFTDKDTALKLAIAFQRAQDAGIKYSENMKSFYFYWNTW